MTALSDQINQLDHEARPLTMCSVCWAFRGAPQDDRKAVNTALAANVVIARLADIIVSNGYDVNADGLRRHHKRGHTL